MKQNMHLVGVFLLIVFGTNVMLYQRFTAWRTVTGARMEDRPRMPMLRDENWSDKQSFDSERWYWEGNWELEADKIDDREGV
ncbi:hypothetical protein [Poriferisphaera sp. WC338]|uniref:hypothetical protein n=1 Tax=Poriferisphaera sp. WC338 TaxID=3425129 RepID=UPI003D813C8C